MVAGEPSLSYACGVNEIDKALGVLADRGMSVHSQRSPRYGGESPADALRRGRGLIFAIQYRQCPANKPKVRGVLEEKLGLRAVGQGVLVPTEFNGRIKALYKAENYVTCYNVGTVLPGVRVVSGRVIRKGRRLSPSGGRALAFAEVIEKSKFAGEMMVSNTIPMKTLLQASLELSPTKSEQELTREASRISVALASHEASGKELLARLNRIERDLDQRSETKFGPQPGHSA